MVDEAGQTRGMGSADYPVHHPEPGFSEQNPDDWWNATVKTVRAVVKQAKLKLHGLDTWDLVLAHARGVVDGPLPPALWRLQHLDGRRAP